MAFSFPYPTLGTVVRPVGQGCVSCVHGTYCPALYWFRRYGLKEPDTHTGLQCTSWSDDPMSMVKTINQTDLDENEYIYNQGIGSEANRGGITDLPTGTNRRP